MNTWTVKTLKIQYLAYFLSIMHFIICAEPIDLNGKQENSYSEGEYLVEEDVIIESGKEMILEAGAVLKFKPYTGLKVYGKLYCRGSSLKSILLTTHIDSNSNNGDNSFIQWNRIEIDSGGSIDFDRVNIFNSVYGIKASKDNDSLVLKDVLFKNNTEDFSVGDSLISVDNNSLYRGSFNTTKPEIPLKEEKSKKQNRGKIVAQVSLAAIGLAGAILAAVSHNKYEDASDIYQTIGKYPNETINKAHDDAEKFGTLRNVSGGVGAASFTGLIITFFF